MDHDNPALIAITDQLEAASADLSAYITGLDTPALLAELRCGSGRLIAYLNRTEGPMHPATITAVALAEGLSRFDLRGAECDDDACPVDHHRDTFRPVPQAVAANEKCECATPRGGLRGRTDAIHTLVHDAMRAQG